MRIYPTFSNLSIKQVPGSGLAVAIALRPASVAAAAIVAPAVVGVVGALPPNFSAILSDYEHMDLLNLMIFYNHSFGIAPGTNLKRRIELFGLYLRNY